MKKYQAKCSPLFYLLVVGMFLIPMVILGLDVEMFTQRPVILLPILPPIFMMLWIYFDTWYGLEGKKLFYKSAFLKGNIPVEQIREIVVGKTSYVGTKAAMGTKGLIVKFNRFDEVYIAPKDNEELVEDLLKINSHTHITKPSNHDQR
ncbi:PH domain-containing protein [Litoribacter populi]|uniref:PH domain-containing protein n=1 Tax=Litoribacter populi TaxID=2598460 RepID=UPI00117E1C4B|nr:PH domain-containing protein [Litoribacter populi]